MGSDTREEEGTISAMKKKKKERKTWVEKRELGSTRQDEGWVVKTLKRNNAVEGWREVLKSFTSGHRGVHWGAGWAREWRAFIIIGSHLHPLLKLTSLPPLT